MDWNRLLSRTRLGRNEQAAGDATRTDFQRDFDRIVFCSAFRRLQDKTQVFPLARSDYVRTRLTHSLEASSVGRTLGTRIGDTLIRRYRLGGVDPQDFGAIVAAACLAHDIGNPPFGHAGEDAIRSWFRESATGQRVLERLSEAQRADLLGFEGNAQGFRLLTRLQSPANPGGLQLTCATLGAFSKYPCAAWLDVPRPHGIGFRKFGFYQADREHFAELADRLGLTPVTTDAWRRHPLSYLVEAADDICYRIVDIEDAYRLRQIDYAEAEALLRPLAETPGLDARLSGIAESKERIELLRAKAIGVMVDQTCAVFLAHEPAILAGELDAELLDLVPSAAELRTLRCYAEDRVYIAPPVVEVGAAGFRVLAGLLETCIGALEDIAEHGRSASTLSRMVSYLIPEQFIGPGRRPADNAYRRVLGMTDFVSGMTDRYAVELYKKITGISLPNG